ncbi:phosphoenolpyruvate carboxykinase, partial [bacterium]
PFCGYNMGDYFAHWLEMGETGGDKMPRIFYVNWFRKDDKGKFVWPGFGENSRVLKWVFERCTGETDAQETPIGLLPADGALDTDGLDVSKADMDVLMAVDVENWKAALPSIEKHFEQFGDDLPKGLHDELEGLRKRLG